MHILIKIKSEVVSAIYSHEILDQRIAQDLSAEKVMLSALSQHYFHKSDHQLGFLLGFSGPKETDMAYMIKRLRHWMLAAIETK